jgi:hypothetical protein
MEGLRMKTIYTILGIILVLVIGFTIGQKHMIWGESQTIMDDNQLTRSLICTQERENTDSLNGIYPITDNSKQKVIGIRVGCEKHLYRYSITKID